MINTYLVNHTAGGRFSSSKRSRVGFARSTTHAATPFVKSMASRMRSRPQFDQSPAQNDNDSANQMVSSS